MNAGRPREPRGRNARAFLVLLALGGCGDDATAPPPSCDGAPTLAAGSPVTSALGPGDRRWGGAFIEYYTLRPTAPMAARIEVTSAAFEPFLLLFDERGTILEQAYDGDPPAEGERTVVLQRVLTRPCYVLGVTSWWSDGAGSYIVTLTWPQAAP